MHALLTVMRRCGRDQMRKCDKQRARDEIRRPRRTRIEDVRSRLMKCFSTVVPALTSGTLANANIANTAECDSIASVTLIALVEEELAPNWM
jgi:hypothetical protein